MEVIRSLASHFSLNSTAYGMHNFDLVVFLNLGCRIFRSGYDLLVKGHSKIRGLNIQFEGQFLKVLTF